MVSKASSAQMVISQNYANENAFKKILQTLAQPKFGRSLLVEASGELRETNFLRALFEKLKGFFGGCNRTNKALVELKVIHFLALGITNNWLKGDDLKLVNQLAKRLGLMPADSLNLAKGHDKHSELRQLVALINATVQNSIKLHQAETCAAIIQHYVIDHQKELSPFHLQMTKFVQDATGVLTKPPVPAIVSPTPMAIPVPIENQPTESKKPEENQHTDSQTQQEPARHAQPDTETSTGTQAQADTDVDSGSMSSEQEDEPRDEQTPKALNTATVKVDPSLANQAEETASPLSQRQITQMTPLTPVVQVLPCAATTPPSNITEDKVPVDRQAAKKLDLKKLKPLAPRQSFCKKVTKLFVGALALFGAGFVAWRYPAHTFSRIPTDAATGLTQTTATFANTYFPHITIDSGALPLQPTSSIQTVVVKPVVNPIENPLVKTKTELEAMEHSLRGSLTWQLQTFLAAPPIKLDKSTLLHIVGDIFGQDTKLEGSQAGIMLNYFQQLLKAKIDTLKQHGICDAEAKHAICGDLFGHAIASTKSTRQAELALFEELARKIDTSMEIEQIFETGNSEKFREKIQSAVEGLAAAQSFFFPGGWAKHAIVYEVLKQPDGLLSFRVYNTGQGLEYYKRAVIETETLYLPFIELVDIPGEKLLDRAVLAALQELRELDKKGIERCLYAQILPQLEGKISNADHKFDELRAAQQSGTCTYMSLLATFSQNLGGQHRPRRFDFETKLKALCDYDTLFSHSYAEDEEGKNLLLKGTAAFAVELEQWHSQGVVSRADMELALGKLYGIQQRLQAAQARQAAKIAAAYPKLQIHPSPAAAHFSKVIAAKWEESTMTAQSQEGGRSLIRSSLKEWAPDGASFAADAEKFLGAFRQSRQAGYVLDTQEAIKEFALKIPLEHAAFWQQLDGSQAPRLLKTFAVLSRDFVTNQLHIGQADANRSMQVKPTDFLTLVKFLTISDKIARQHAKTLGFELPSLRQQSFDLFLDNGSLHFAIFDPAWALEAAAIKAYWAQPGFKIKEKSFFNFEEYPAGQTSQVWGDDSTNFLPVPPFVYWVVEWIKQDHIQAEIAKNYPELLNEKFEEQAAQALSWQTSS